MTTNKPGVDLAKVLANKAKDVAELQEGLVMTAFDLVDPPVSWRD